MTPRSRLVPSRRVLRHLAGVAGLLPALGLAATYNWNGGSGAWDTTTASWTGAGTTWPAAGTDNDAVFGGTAGTLTIAAGGVTANDLTFNTTGYVIGGAALTLNGTLPAVSVASGVSATVDAVIAGSAGFNKTGAGTLTLNGTNTRTGTTQFSQGVVSVPTLTSGTLAGPLGATGGQSANMVFAGGTLRYTGGTTTWGRAFTLGTGGGSIDVSSAGTTLTLSPNFNISGSDTITGAGGLTKLGPGTLVLTVNSSGSGTMPTFTGGITVNAGTLRLAAGNFNTGIVRGTAVVNNGGTLDVGGTNTASGQPLTSSDTITVNGGGVLNASASGGTMQDAVSYFGTLNLDSSNGTTAQVTASVATSGLRARTTNPALITSAGAVANTYAAHLYLVNLGAPGIATISTGSGNTLNFTGTILDYTGLTGTGLVKEGAGTLTLSGPNSYSGNTTLGQGTLRLNSSTAAGSAGTITLGSASTGSGNLQLVFGAGGISRPVTVANLGTGAVNILGNAQFQSQTGALTLNRAATIEIPANGTGTDWWFSFGALAGTAPLTVKGGSGGPTAGGSGNRIMLNSASTHSAGVIIESGKLQLGSATGAGTGPITLGNASTGTAVTQLRVGGNVANTIVVSAAPGVGSPAGIGTFNTLQTLSGALQVNRPLEINGASDRLTWSGAGAVWSGASDITINGGRVTHDSVANTWTGNLVINASSTFQPGHASTLTAANSVTANGTLQLNNVPQTINGLSGGGTVQNVVGANTLTVGAGNATASFTGVVQNGSGALSLVKQGSGAQTLGGNNTYTGSTTVNQGLLIVSGGNGIGDSSAVGLANTAGAGLQLNANETVGSLAGGGASGGNVNVQGFTLTAGGNGNSTSYSGVISGTGGFTKAGGGTLTFPTAGHTYTGPTAITGGTLEVSTGNEQSLGLNPGAFASGQLRLNGGTLRVSGSSLTLDDSNRGVTIGTSPSIGVAGTGNGTFLVDSGLTLSLTRTLNANTSGTLAKAGPGRLNLTADAAINALAVQDGWYDQQAGVSTILATGTGIQVGSTATYQLSGGTLRTDRVDVLSGGRFKWGPGTLMLRSSNGNAGAVDYTAAGYQAVKSGVTGQFGGALTSEPGSVLAMHGSPTLYLNAGVRFNNWAVTGDLDLTASGDTLEFALNPYLLRPFSSAGVGAIETGSLPLLTWTGTFAPGGAFDLVTGIVSQGAGFTQFIPPGPPVTDPAQLDPDTWFIEYDQADRTIWFHFKVTGYVPEPGGFGMVAAGVIALRLCRRLSRLQRRVAKPS